ncbi:MAG TPA: DegV family protein [Ktedonobacterales bacterium]|nr:DegV family protein [Ktedonobacterales bacterium]
MAVRILVDSTADLPPERARELGITVAPLTVLFGDESFRDGVDLDGRAFYERLAKSSVTPTTSTPPPGLFEEYYRKLISDGATGILAIHIGSGLSATYSVSRTAADVVSPETGVPIEVLDSGTVSGGFGLTAQIVAREANNGASLEQVTEHAKSLLSRTHLVAVLDTLEYLRRGGRIGNAQALLGGLLNVKPLLGVRDSQVIPLERVRTRGKALERIGQLIASKGEPEAVAVAASDDTVAVELTNVAHSFWSGPIERFLLGPVVGTHAGPGAGAIISITKA